jgi:ribosomal protein S17E
MQKQIEMSERLFNFMKQDFSHNQSFIQTLTETIKSLSRKLEARDEEIRRLRNEVASYKALDEQTND